MDGTESSKREDVYDVTKQIRVLHVVTAMNRGGTETMLMNIYRKIDRNIVQFDFAVSTNEKSDFDDEIIEMGGQVIRYPRYKGYNHFMYVRWWRRFLIDNDVYDMIHGHVGSTAAIYLSIAKSWGKYTIAHSHNANDIFSIRRILFDLYSYRTRFIADYFMGCSYEALVSRYGRRVAISKRSMVLKNAIDSEKFIFNQTTRENLRKELKLNDNTLVVGSVGMMIRQKNPSLIIEIILKLKERGVDFKFLWIGDGYMRTQIENKIRQLSLEDTVLFLGNREDIAELLQSLDVFILPSLSEGFGIAALESQAAGLPTICSDVIPKAIKITELCKFVSLSNVGAWVEEIVNSQNVTRKDTSKYIADAGFDVKSTSKWIQAFYIDLEDKFFQPKVGVIK